MASSESKLSVNMFNTTHATFGHRLNSLIGWTLVAFNSLETTEQRCRTGSCVITVDVVKSIWLPAGHRSFCRGPRFCVMRSTIRRKKRRCWSDGRERGNKSWSSCCHATICFEYIRCIQVFISIKTTKTCRILKFQSFSATKEKRRKNAQWERKGSASNQTGRVQPRFPSRFCEH